MKTAGTGALGGHRRVGCTRRGQLAERSGCEGVGVRADQTEWEVRSL